MPHRVIAAALLGSLLCAAPRQACAGDPPLPMPPAQQRLVADAATTAWPAELKHRNARYASLTRVDDPSGDVHERLIAHMQMSRVVDRIGDLEEVRRRRTSSVIPPLAVKDALVMRDRDVRGDDNEVVLASIRHERRHAETRRFRDLAGDSTELAAYKDDLKRIRLDRGERILMGAGEQHEMRGMYFDSREDQEARDTGDTMGEASRAEARDEAAEERDIIREEENTLRGLGGEDEDGIGFREDDPLEELGEGSDVRMEESQLERETEAQLEQEEAAGAGGTP